jgi:hypothetical protein
MDPRSTTEFWGQQLTAQRRKKIPGFFLLSGRKPYFAGVIFCADRTRGQVTLRGSMA